MVARSIVGAPMSLLGMIPAKYRESVLLFGGSLLAGFLVFLIWFARQPSLDVSPVAKDAAAASDDARKPATSKDGVLDGIGGGMESGGSAKVVDLESAPVDVVTGPEPDNGADSASSDAAATTLSDEQALAGGLLGPADADLPPPLQAWYVEVARGPGVTEVLKIDAPSSDQALTVLRNFRGNPRVVRGPSAKPLP